MYASEQGPVIPIALTLLRTRLIVVLVTLSTVVVDDEPLARRRLRELLAGHEDIQVLGEAASAREAVTLIRETRPRLLFLDVQMPREDGFEVVRQLDETERPLVVFITAYEEYAFHAFRASAVQYLLKPVDRGELRSAIARVRQIAFSGAGARDVAAVSALVREIHQARTASRKVVVKTNGRTLLFDVAQIDRLEAAGNYVRLYIGRKHYLVRDSMAGLEGRLDPKTFVRIHRSTIVNIDRIREFHAVSHGDLELSLDDGTALAVSRVYRDRFEFLVGHL